MHNYLLIIERGDECLWGYFPDVPGCTTAGATVEEVRASAVAALASHLEDEAPPRPQSLAQHLKDGLELDGTEVLTWVAYEPQTVAAV